MYYDILKQFTGIPFELDTKLWCRRIFLFLILLQQLVFL